MPKRPVVSGAQAIRALERLGYVAVRQRGSHVVPRRAERGCIVPLHGEIRAGTLATILRQAGVPDDDFFGAIR